MYPNYCQELVGNVLPMAETCRKQVRQIYTITGGTMSPVGVTNPGDTYINCLIGASLSVVNKLYNDILPNNFVVRVVNFQGNINFKKSITQFQSKNIENAKGFNLATTSIATNLGVGFLRSIIPVTPGQITIQIPNYQSSINFCNRLCDPSQCSNSSIIKQQLKIEAGSINVKLPKNIGEYVISKPYISGSIFKFFLNSNGGAQTNPIKFYLWFKMTKTSLTNSYQMDIITSPIVMNTNYCNDIDHLEIK